MEGTKTYIESKVDIIQFRVGENTPWYTYQETNTDYMREVFKTFVFVHRGAPLEILLDDDEGEISKYMEVYDSVVDLLIDYGYDTEEIDEFSDYLYHEHGLTIF